MKLRKNLKSKMEAKHIFYIIMVILYVYLISECIFQYISGAGLSACKLEFFLMIAFSFIIYFINFFNLDFFNKTYRKSKKKIDIHQGMKNCLLSSVFLSLIITTFLYLLIAYEIIYIDFYNVFPSHPAISIIGLAILIYIVLFVIIYFFHLHFLRKNSFIKK